MRVEDYLLDWIKKDNDNIPKVCVEVDYDAVGKDGKTKDWYCGVPKAGKSGEFGDNTFDSNIPQNDKGYATTACAVHITHYQKPDPSKDPYSLAVSIKDANGDEIGKLDKTEIRGPTNIRDKLPYYLIVDPGKVDADPISVKYAGESWKTDDLYPDGTGRCGVGAYDNGKREIDCGFHCE
ncbi:MAG: hypothetical protein M1833_004695 [Piccolia ochrophora]|nr:MAG: hypothetical protein M1833_004695 [Piccolia ochrophora]